MSDKLFFPVAFLLAGLLVFFAIDPLADRPPRGPVSGGGRVATDITIAGDELQRFVPGKIGGIEILPAVEATPITLRLQRMANQLYEDPRDGPHLVIAEDVEVALAGKPVEVTFEARAFGGVAAEQFEVNYFAAVGSESGWRSFPLTSQFAPYSFVWTPPEQAGVLGYDYLGVRPVTPEKRRSLEIRSIRIRLAPGGAG
jgi:hypothetical protein